MTECFDPASIRALTFDCYGTLIDWLAGIRAGLAQMPSLAGCDLDRLVADRDRIDEAVVTGAFAPYGTLLANSVRQAARLQGREPSAGELERFVEGMGDWPAFADSAAALERLARRYRLAILSNVEDRILERSISRLGAHFETTVSAEQVRAYKPDPKHFHTALERLNLPAHAVVHVACSPFHDLCTAGQLGWRTIWVRRDAASRSAEVRPNLTVADLADVAWAMGV